MEIAEHGDDGGGDFGGGLVGSGYFVDFAHYGVDHQVGRVAFDDIGCWGRADDMGLRLFSWCREVERGCVVRDQLLDVTVSSLDDNKRSRESMIPNRAEAMAEK